VGLASVQVQTEGTRAHRDIERDVEPLVAVFEEAEDHRGAADALRLLGLLKRWSSEYAAAADLQERALLHARQVADERREAAIIRHIGSILLWGPQHVDPALVRCRAILDGASNGRVRANCLVRIGGLEGLAGRFDAAWEAIDQARAVMDDLGLRHLKAHSSDVAVLVATLAGDFERAECEARSAYAVLAEMGDRTFQATEALLVGEALAAQGRNDEASEWLAIRKEVGDDSGGIDLETLLAAQRGLLDEAEELARASLALGESPVPLTIDPRFTLAEILLRSGRVVEAETEVEACLLRYNAKGIVPLAEKARALLTEIQTAARQT
jgi:tetratricopeptide (TPR) repeat protein